MNKFFKKLMVIIYFLFLPYVSMAGDGNNCKKIGSIVSKFVNSAQNQDWSKVRSNVYKFQKCKCEIAPVLYYIYRMRVLLPNSHALQGITPDEFVESQELKMKEQVNILKTCRKYSYTPLINSMAKQSFDEEMSQAAIALEKKLV